MLRHATGYKLTSGGHDACAQQHFSRRLNALPHSDGH
jgi:hypothetical protein